MSSLTSSVKFDTAAQWLIRPMNDQQLSCPPQLISLNVAGFKEYLSINFTYYRCKKKSFHPAIDAKSRKENLQPDKA